MRSLQGRIILVVGFSLSSLLICPVTPFWLAELLLKDQLLTLCGFPCMLFVAFPLLFLILLLFYLIFDSLVNMCLRVFLLEFILYGSLCFLDLGGYFLSMLGKFSTIISSDIFFGPFSLSSPSGTPVM